MRRRCSQRSEAVVVTKGEKGASVMLKDRTIDVPAVPPSEIVDPDRRR